MPLTLQEARFAEQLRRLFSLQGYLGLNLVDDVLPTVDILSQLPELGHLRNEYRYALAVIQGATVGNFGFLEVQNPVGSRVLTIIETVRAEAVGATFGAGRVTSGVIAPNTRPLTLDSRNVRQAQTQAIGGSTAGPPVVDLQWAFSNATIEPRTVLAPGFSWSVNCQTSNLAVAIFVQVREKPLTDEELRA